VRGSSADRLISTYQERPGLTRKCIIEVRERRSRMNMFKTFTLKWWQTSLFKLGMLTLGITIGAYWHYFFGGYLLILLIVAAISLACVTYVWWKQ